MLCPRSLDCSSSSRSSGSDFKGLGVTSLSSLEGFCRAGINWGRTLPELSALLIGPALSTLSWGGPVGEGWGCLQKVFLRPFSKSSPSSQVPI